MAEKTDRLRSVPLFAGLSKRNLRTVLESGKELRYARGEFVVREGMDASAFYLVLEGEASIKRGGRTIRRFVVGEFFGEISVLDPGPRTATIVADAPLTLFRLDRKSLLSLLDREGEIGRKLLVELAKRFRTMRPGQALD